MLSTGICRWLFLLISLSTWMKLIDSKEMRVVCYYTNWSVYRPGQAKFSPQNINPYLCTHLIYAFGGFTKENTLKPFDKYQDIEKGGYAKFVGLKTYNKNLKTMIAIGGWNEGSSRFSPMVASAERRKELVKNAIKFLRQNHFDGLDLDWEYPTFRDGGKPRDRDNYAKLVQELREEFERESEKTGRPRLLLTMAVPAGIEYINKGYDVPKLTKYLDWMNILSYDYHSAFEPAVNHHAPLYSLEEDNEYNYDAELNIDYTIKHYLKLGADPNKLVLGIPTYGRSYTLFNPDAYEIGAPADGPGDMGEATRENGYLAYYEICEYIKDQDWEVDEPNPDAMGPIAFKGNQWVGYDDENIVRKKAQYVAENSLGGIMFWAIDNDDFRGNCHGRPYPLIEAAKEALINAYGLTEENLISPPSKPTKSSKQKSRTRTRKTTTTTEIPEETSAATRSSSRRRRIKNKSKSEDRSLSSPVQKRRKDKVKPSESSTYSSLKVITPAYTTPAPPATPDMGGAFKCEDEGFFPHPKDCKKYFWCLGGPGDTGIVAHQFTCPAGLYFNKGADSCDYSQNVLCNKKLQKATTTEKIESATASTEKSTASSIFTTARVPPKITAATSKTTFRQTTTTESYEDEYEYDDEDDDEDENKPEEDPQVIKELINLIKKAGGIEELEKHLISGKDSSFSTATSDSTTPSALSKSLVERVLGRTNKNTLNALKRTSGNRNIGVNRNSGGPQGGAGSEEKKNDKLDRFRPQYQTISRQRASTEKSVEEEEAVEKTVEGEAVEEKKSFRSKSALEYVNIRRPKSSSTTEATKDDGFNRNKILGESIDDEQNDEAEDYEEVTKKNNIPQYVNIRRQRPSTTEATGTSSKYTSIRRSTMSPADSEDEETSEESKYKTIRRGTTTEPNESPDSQTSKYQTIRRGTTTSATVPEDNTESERYQTIRRGTTTSATIPEESTESERYQTIRRGTTTPATIAEDNSGSERYQTISRGTPPTAATTPEENTDSERYQTIRRGTTTTATIPDDDAETKRRKSTTDTTYESNSVDSKYNFISRSTTTPSGEEVNNDINSKYQSIRRTSTPSENSSSEESTTSAQLSTEKTSSETLRDLPATTLLQETSSNLSTVATENLVSSTHESTTESNNDITSSFSESSSVTPTEINELVTEKKRPVLYQPRPFSVGTASTAKPTTAEPTTITSKVSQSNLRFRLRQTSSPTTSTEASSTTVRTRSRSRFRSNNRNLSEDQEQEEKYERTVENKPIRTRKRLRVSTEKPVDYNEEYNRKYRPAELADLSSLTAADLNLKGNGFVSANRRRRPTGTSTTTTTTTEESLTDFDKTGSRTLPLVRKLIDPSTFGKSRRVVAKNEDQINASSDTTSRRKIVRGSRPTTPKNDLDESENIRTVSEESASVTPRPRKIFRRFRPTSAVATVTSEKPYLEDSASTTTSTPRSSTLIRKRIPLFRSRQNRNEVTPGKTENIVVDTTTENLTTSDSPLSKLFETTSRFDIAKNFTGEDEDDDEHVDVLNGEEGENIKLSESNIRESSKINAFGLDEKPGKKYSKSNSGKADISIKSSTENQQKELLLDDNIQTITTKEQNIDSTTKAYGELARAEPTRILRTRKIIRKLSTTEPPTVEKSYGRRRKVLRQPIATNINEFETKTKDETDDFSGKTYYTLSRFNSETSTDEPETTSKNIANEVTRRRILRPSYARTTSTEQAEVNEEQNETSINRFRYSRPTTEESISSKSAFNLYRRPTFSTTESEESVNQKSVVVSRNHDDSEEDDEEDDEEEEEEEGEENIENGGYADDDDGDEPNYTIYTTSSVNRTHKYESNTNFDDENGEALANGIKANNTVTSVILTTALNSRNESETVLRENGGLNDGEKDLQEDNKNSETENESTDITTKRNNLLRTPKKRPSFTRQRTAFSREEVQTKSQKDVLKSVPAYRSRSTPRTTTVVTTTTTTTRPISEATDITEPIKTTELELNGTLELRTETNLDETTTDDVNNDLTEKGSVPVTEAAADLVSTTLALNSVSVLVENTEETLVPTTEEPQETTLSETPEGPTVTFNEIEGTTEYLNSEDVTATTDTLSNTTLTENIAFVTIADTTTEYEPTNLTETTTVYRRRSTFRSIKERPRLGFSRRTTATASISSTTEPNVEVSSRKAYTRTFNKNSRDRFKVQSTRNDLVKPVLTTVDRVSTPLPINRFIYKYSTTVRTRVESGEEENLDDEEDIDHEEGIVHEDNSDEDNEDDEELENEDEGLDSKEDDVATKSFRPSFPRSSTTTRTVNKPFDARTTKNNQDKSKLTKDKFNNVVDDLEASSEAIKNRNKNLFFKRKMNTPFKPTSTVSSNEITTEESSATETSELNISETTSLPNSSQTDSTDPNLTTLHHVFADFETTDSTTESMDSVSNQHSGKVERLIEVNRIVEIQTKEAHIKNHSGVLEEATKVKIVPTVDKIGEISRITQIHIVDGNNETIVEDPESNVITTSIEASTIYPIYVQETTKTPLEIAKVEDIKSPENLPNVSPKNIEFNIQLDNGAASQREERKYEIFGESKVSDNKVIPSINGKPEIIDGISHINYVTPKAIVTEASTISLQGLFQTEHNHLNPSFTTNDEALETGRSEFVNVRVLDQDEHVRLDKSLLGDTNFIPVRVLPQDEEEVTMKAHVVEIRPKPNARTIKIVPIKVEMSRSLASFKLPPNTNAAKT